MVYEEQPEKEGTVTGGRSRKRKKKQVVRSLAFQIRWRCQASSLQGRFDSFQPALSCEWQPDSSSQSLCPWAGIRCAIPYASVTTAVMIHSKMLKLWRKQNSGHQIPPYLWRKSSDLRKRVPGDDQRV